MIEPYYTYAKLVAIAALLGGAYYIGHEVADRSWTIKTDALKIAAAKSLQGETEKALVQERARKALADFIQINYNQKVDETHELQNHIDDVIATNNGLRDKWSRNRCVADKGAGTSSGIPAGGIIPSGERGLSIQLSTALSRDYGRAERFRRRFAATQAWAKTLNQ